MAAFVFFFCNMLSGSSVITKLSPEFFCGAEICTKKCTKAKNSRNPNFLNLLGLGQKLQRNETMFLQPLLENLLQHAGYQSTLAFVSTCKEQQQSRNWLIANCTVVDHCCLLADRCRCVSLASADTIAGVLRLSSR